MKFQPTALIRAGVFLLVVLFSARAAAQLSNLDELASQIAKEVKPCKPHLVAVADFRPPYGSTMP
jgi:hypothetical protein